jgi:hypothetical protein
VAPPIYTIPTCPDNCLGHGKCENFTLPAHCFDGSKDNDETDVDCGGPSCYACPPTDKCLQDSDCLTGLCQNSTGGYGKNSSYCGTGCTCGGSGFYNGTNSNTSQHCVCFRGYSGNNCGIIPPSVISSVAVIGVSLGVAAVVGIVIAAVVVCAGLGGGAVVAYSKFQDDDAGASVSSNPLYTGRQVGGANPLHKEDC